MSESAAPGFTRRQMLKVGGATFAGYAVAVDKALAQAMKTDTQGILAGDVEVKIGDLLRQHNPNAEIVICPGAGHGFFADYRPSYNAPAADAWRRCPALFDKHLKA